MTEGSIEYRGHVFEVTSGFVGFLNPKQIEPSFDFSGRTEVTGFDREGVVTDYTVELLATGVPEKFKLDLVSSPALSETDIVSLLTWGAVGEQAFALRSGISAEEATLLLTRELKGKLETEVERVTGFDRFTINPTAISSSGERTTRIQVDKKLSEKFYLTYSTPILASEEQEVLVKFRITKSLSLIGEQLGERDYGLDLDFQFEIP
jgi:autotransporter translocation and assembly factor TamB